MATDTIGQASEFNPENDSVTAYVERVLFFLEANEVKKDKYVAVLLSTISVRTHVVLRNFLVPELLRKESFERLVDALKCHYKPKSLVIAERFKFLHLNQAHGETVSSFVAEVR